MNEGKQIKEMTQDMYDALPDYEHNFRDCESAAEELFSKGWRKQSEVIDEFAEKLKEAPIKCGIPLIGLYTRGEIEDYFNGIMLQVRDAIDNIAKEMKGV